MSQKSTVRPPRVRRTRSGESQAGRVHTNGAARPSPSSEWLNHAPGNMTRDIFVERRGKRRDWKQLLARSARVGSVWLGRGAVRLGKHALRLGRFSVRQMQPMRWRDWVTVAALVMVLIAMGTYMALEERAGMLTQRQGCRWHVVEAGDTLITLARASGLSVGEIAHANGFYDVKDLPIGQELCIPSTSDVAQAASGVAPASHTDGPVIQGQAAYVRFALPYARRAHEATGWPVSMILAQWGLEQGWQTPTFTGYNFGNCGGLLDEPFIPGTSVPGSPATFAYADTPEDGLRFYIHVAHLHYYDQVALAAKQGGAVAAAKALGASPWDAHHYTDHDDPGSSLVALMQRYHLQQYD